MCFEKLFSENNFWKMIFENFSPGDGSYSEYIFSKAIISTASYPSDGIEKKQKQIKLPVFG